MPQAPRKYPHDYAKELQETHLPIKFPLVDAYDKVTLTAEDTYATFIERFLPALEMMEIWGDAVDRAENRGDKEGAQELEALQKAYDLSTCGMTPANETAREQEALAMGIAAHFEKQRVLPAFLKVVEKMAAKQPLEGNDARALKKGIAMLEDLYEGTKDLNKAMSASAGIRNITINAQRRLSRLQENEPLPPEIIHPATEDRKDPDAEPKGDPNTEEEGAVEYANRIRQAQAQLKIFDGMMPLVRGLVPNIKQGR